MPSAMESVKSACSTFSANLSFIRRFDSACCPIKERSAFLGAVLVAAPVSDHFRVRTDIILPTGDDLERDFEPVRAKKGS